MERFVSAVDQAVAAQNWFGALFIALALPDICGALETPDRPVGARYKDWFSRYVAPSPHNLLTADECYVVRCKCLHQGLSTDDHKTGRQLHFTKPIPRCFIHGNYINGALQLQIDVFCGDVVSAVERWRRDVADDARIQKRMSELMAIHG